MTYEADGTKKTFRASVIENFKEFYDNFKRMNVRYNAQLEQLIEQANGLVTGIDAKELRKNTQMQEQLRTSMGELQSSLDNLIVNAPRRRVMPLS